MHPTDSREDLLRDCDTNLAGSEARYDDLQRLIDRLASEHGIDDRAGLAQAVRTTMLIYGDRGDLDKKAAKSLLTSIPKITDVLFREGNDLRLAHLVTDRELRLEAGLAGRDDVEAWS
jgi:hypothetical protein